MKGHGTKFGRKMEAAIAALLTARNIEAGAPASEDRIFLVRAKDGEPDYSWPEHAHV